MSKEIEIVKVTLELPKQVADFIKDSWATDNLSETLTKEIVTLCVSQLEADANEEGIKPLELGNKYGLIPIFKQYEVLPEYYQKSETASLAKIQKDLDLQMIPVKIELAKPFFDFIEEYHQYFGGKYSIEMICMSMVYSQVKRLFNELNSFARNKDSFLDKSDFFTKNFYLGSVCFGDPEED